MSHVASPMYPRHARPGMSASTDDLDDRKLRPVVDKIDSILQRKSGSIRTIMWQRHYA